jgi:hypothetical protein
MPRFIKLFALLALVTPMTMACVADSDPLAPEETEEALSLPPFRYQSLYMEAGGTVVQDLMFYTSMEREMDIRDIKVAVDSKSNAIVVVAVSLTKSSDLSNPNRAIWNFWVAVKGVGIGGGMVLVSLASNPKEVSSFYVTVGYPSGKG